MSDRRPPEPSHVVAMVEDYVRAELHSAEQYTNRSPLDESGIWDLHAMAARIYATGWRDGEASAEERSRWIRDRERDAARKAAEAAAAETGGA